MKCTHLCTEKNNRKIKYALKNMVREFFDGNLILEYAYKVTSDDFS